MTVDELTPGDVVVRVQWSGINYKDALAVTGRGKILKRFPLNAGIDAAGVVESSSDARFATGDAVLVQGMGLGESHDGGFAERLRVPGDFVVAAAGGPHAARVDGARHGGLHGRARDPARMELLGQRPELGPIAVTGARAASARSPSRCSRHAATRSSPCRGGRSTTTTCAGSGLTRSRHRTRSRSARARSRPRASAARSTTSAASCSPASCATWLPGARSPASAWPRPRISHTSVFPLILRGVSLLGVTSTNCPMPLRKLVWERLGAELRPPGLAAIVSRVVPLAQRCSMQLRA